MKLIFNPSPIHFAPSSSNLLQEWSNCNNHYLFIYFLFIYNYFSFSHFTNWTWCQNYNKHLKITLPLDPLDQWCLMFIYGWWDLFWGPSFRSGALRAITYYETQKKQCRPMIKLRTVIMFKYVFILHNRAKTRQAEI